MAQQVILLLVVLGLAATTIYFGYRARIPAGHRVAHTVAMALVGLQGTILVGARIPPPLLTDPTLTKPVRVLLTAMSVLAPPNEFATNVAVVAFSCLISVCLFLVYRANELTLTPQEEAVDRWFGMVWSYMVANVGSGENAQTVAEGLVVQVFRELEDESQRLNGEVVLRVCSTVRLRYERQVQGDSPSP